MIRIAEIIAGVVLVGFGSWLALADTTPALCIAGHPAPRHNVTYAGLPPRHGYQRDHVIPLCLGGPDTLANLQYQPLATAEVKDRLEWSTCEAYCRGEITLDQARSRFRSIP